MAIIDAEHTTAIVHNTTSKTHEWNYDTTLASQHSKGRVCGLFGLQAMPFGSGRIIERNRRNIGGLQKHAES